MTHDDLRDTVINVVSTAILGVLALCAMALVVAGTFIVVRGMLSL